VATRDDPREYSAGSAMRLSETAIRAEWRYDSSRVVSAFLRRLACRSATGALMSSAAITSSVLAIGLLGFAGASIAHHPPRFERCQRFTVTGQLERIEWTNPHVLLLVRTDDGLSHEVGWLSVQRLRRADIQIDTLRIGDRLVIEGGIRAKDADNEPILLSSIRRITDGWEWSQRLQGC
jgi:hypothetical protein